MITPVRATVVAVLALVCASFAGAATTTGTIVFAADRAPLLAGEIMRVAPDGSTTNLSRSLAREGAPAVSPDGRLVAFSSGRGGRRAEYVVGVDGSRLRRISPFLGPADPNAGPSLEAAWAPGGTSLAVLVSTYSPVAPRIYLASPSGKLWRALTRPADKALALAGWSPGGRLAYVSPETGSVRVVDTRGKVLLDTAGRQSWWSPSGRLAVKRSTDVIEVYDARLKRIGTVGGDNAAWSADGRLATISSTGLLAIRPDGTGKPTLLRRVGRGEPLIQWVGTKRLRYLGTDGWVIVDARTGHTFLAAGAFAVFNSVVSADGILAVGEQWAREKKTLLRTRLGGSTTKLGTTDACGYDGSAWDRLQLLPDGSAVYDTQSCFVSSDIWSVSASGGAPARLTKTPADETQPALSPDGSRIAFSEKLTASKCDGCDETLWVMNADGSGARAFPNGPDPNVNFDDSPSFSPDGATILFARSGPSAAGLWTVPSAGGPAKPLGLPGLYPVWGPTRIAYEDLVDGLRVADPDGRNATDLHVDGTPGFSPSGRLALLRTSASGALSLYFPDSKKAIPLPGLRGTYRGVGLAWSPDGTRLALAAFDAAGVGDVWTVGADGKGLTRVTHGLGAGGPLSWR
jgi:Tol biopolymer transport system component